jgi:hypothetical protein
MSKTDSTKDTFRFDAPGTLQRPGPIGRFVRLTMGALCLYLVWVTMATADVGDIDNLGILFWFAFGIWVLPALVNIGLGRKWGMWPPRIVGMALAVGAALVGYVSYGAVLSEPLWWVIKVGIIYIFGHLGVSFVLASILATPGCEMRAIPHLVGTISGRASKEHYCPGFIDNVDRWETKLKKP